ncbi:glycosyltransferase [Photobacterium leiognathi]|uniref:glycosyltransferase n=1 Tax=Photobacterium leiognathi TaxID=553611 RepID=UPI0027393B00|nr:glycosyltransferase [Photobacterium leiognathi]
MNNPLTNLHTINPRVSSTVSKIVGRLIQVNQTSKDLTLLSIDTHLTDKADSIEILPTEGVTIAIVTYLDYKLIKLLSVCDGVLFVGQALEDLANLFYVYGGFEKVQLSKKKSDDLNTSTGQQLLKKQSKIALYHHFESTEADLMTLDVNNVTSEFVERCIARKSNFINSQHKDEYHLVAGAPVSNKFIFSVCFRNQDQKLLRCVDSISQLASAHDIGLVLIDDNSDRQDSLYQAIQMLQERGVDVHAVISPLRYGAARNLYNIVHHLSVGDEGWFIEVDGDDFILPDAFEKMLNEVEHNNADKVFGGLCVHRNGVIDHTKKFAHEKRLNNYQTYLNMSKLSAWLAPRVTKKSIMKQVHINYFLEIDGQHWLKCIHDSCVHAHAFKLSQKNRILEIPYSVYVYDIDGQEHDTNEYTGEDIDTEWDYGSYTINNPYLFNTWAPLMEEPKEVRQR